MHEKSVMHEEECAESSAKGKAGGDRRGAGQVCERHLVEDRWIGENAHESRVVASCLAHVPAKSFPVFACGQYILVGSRLPFEGTVHFLRIGAGLREGTVDFDFERSSSASRRTDDCIH